MKRTALALMLLAAAIMAAVSALGSTVGVQRPFEEMKNSRDLYQ